MNAELTLELKQQISKLSNSEREEVRLFLVDIKRQRERVRLARRRALDSKRAAAR